MQGVEEWGRGEWKHLSTLVHDVSGEPQIERSFFFFFFVVVVVVVVAAVVVHSDKNSGSYDVCRGTLEVLSGAVQLFS